MFFSNAIVKVLLKDHSETDSSHDEVVMLFSLDTQSETSSALMRERTLISWVQGHKNAAFRLANNNNNNELWFQQLKIRQVFLIGAKRRRSDSTWHAHKKACKHGKARVPQMPQLPFSSGAETRDTDMADALKFWFFYLYTAYEEFPRPPHICTLTILVVNYEPVALVSPNVQITMTHLIHNHNLNFIHFRDTLLDQVQYPAWCRYDDVHYNTKKTKGQEHIELNARKFNNVYIQNNWNLFLFKLSFAGTKSKIN